MTRSNNRLTRLAGGALAFGVALCLIALVLVRFDVTALGENVDYEQKSAAFAAADMRRIEVQNPMDDILVSPSADGQIHVYYSESEKDVYEVSQENGALKVRYQSLRHWYDYIGFNIGANGRKPLRLEVPADSALAMQINATNGQVSINGLAALEGLEVSSTNGAIDVREAKVAGDVKLSTTNGDVTARAVAIQGSLQLSGSNGAMQAQDLDVQGNLRAGTTNGRVSLLGVRPGADVTLSSTNGEIYARFAGSADDYRVEARTTNGQVDAPKGREDAPKKLSAATTNGGVSIQFADESR